MNNLLNDLLNQIKGYYDILIAVLPKLAIAAVVFFFFLFIARRAQKIVTGKLSSRMDDPLLAIFLGRIVKIALVLCSLMIVMKIVGLADVAAGLLAGASISAFIVGFAFKDIVENFLAGIMLAFNRPFRIGDTVELDGHKGKVVTLDMRTTRIKTFDGKDIFIPNANVIKNAVVNYTLDGLIRSEFNIGLDYGSDIHKAIEIVENEMNQIDGILKENKAPSILIGRLSPSTLDLTVQYWINTFNDKISSKDIRINAIKNTMSALDKAGFYLPGDIVEVKNYKEAV